MSTKLVLVHNLPLTKSDNLFAEVVWEKNIYTITITKSTCFLEIQKRAGVGVELQ
jgi:hypothetical protein